ncbi:hypothetical protein SLS56_008167 [Neofusicoccum ribis]|uniref:Uncharacterized protein n=1 Tax=Neofusicoccum ribis TaxID=45134 RepID=A0ABR3SKU4_9PEZI
MVGVRFVDPAAPDRTETALRHPLPAPGAAPFPSCPSHGRPAPTAAGWNPALAPASTSSESERASIPPSTSLTPATDPETLEYDELLPIQDASALFPATVPAALPLTAFQDAIFITYTRSHLLRGVNDYSTLFQTLSPPSTHPLTSTSLISLSTTYFALSHPSAPSLRLRSHARYATALSAVNAALSAGPSPPIADALTAVVALALHEFLAPTAPAAWLAHCLGLARLFELRGARAVAAHPGLRALFETTRPVVIVAALAARRRCVFADGEWRRVPWEAAGAPKDRVHLLMDLLVEGPGLLEERAGGVAAEGEGASRGAGGVEA